MAKTNYSDDSLYTDWASAQNFKTLPSTVLQKMDDEIREKVKDELSYLIKMDATEYALWHKFNEVQEWLPNQKMSHINWVKRTIWKPQGKSDYRRIEPELIFVKDSFHIKSKNIWGEDASVELENKEPHGKHWDIIRTLVSTGRNDGTIGRALRFIVRDKNTKMYLGVICLGSSMAMLKPRNDAIGWKKTEEYFYRGSKLDNIANGQSIVPTQPFGSAYLGGKLLSLLCLSDVVQKKWKEVYGHHLVEVDTTSLWGDMKGGLSQYDNLSPYWDPKLGDTQGETPLKPTDPIYFAMKEWMLVRYPKDFYRHFVELGPTGKLMMRENKTRAIQFCYSKLGFKKDEFLSHHKRGVYRSRLYRNTNEFLRGEITEDQLIPAFDNSVEALTEFWKFGTMGDTKDLDQEAKDKLKNDPKKIANKVRMKGMVKGQIDSRGHQSLIQTEGSRVDWYLDLGTNDWQTVRAKYIDQVGR